MAQRLRRFHRWHALVMSVVVIMAAGSGLVHTWMSHHQPPPPAARPAAGVDLAAATLSVQGNQVTLRSGDTEPKLGSVQREPARVSFRLPG
ncbi:MAG: hypothetical protein J0M02_11990, partial [Planctomycetes bacterium]|nr:hypothetical protein [Planctomycetota bacterium]